MAYDGSSASTVLTLLGFCVSVLFIVFVCSRLACALLARRRRSRRRSPAAAGVLPRYAAAAISYAFSAGGGLDPAALAAFPARAFRRGSAASDAQCVVCLAEYEDNDMLRFLPYCGHGFHMACIDLWLEQNSTCPVCRVSLLHDNNNLVEDSHVTPLPPPGAVVVSSPCSPQSDPCRCLFVSSGHSSRAPAEVPRHEPDEQENRSVVSGPSPDGAANNLQPSSPPPEHNSQTVRKQQVDDRSPAQPEPDPCK